MFEFKIKMDFRALPKHNRHQCHFRGSLLCFVLASHVPSSFSFSFSFCVCFSASLSSSTMSSLFCSCCFQLVIAKVHNSSELFVVTSQLNEPTLYFQVLYSLPFCTCFPFFCFVSLHLPLLLSLSVFLFCCTHKYSLHYLM